MKADLTRSVLLKHRRPAVVDDVIAIARKGTLHVYTPGRLVGFEIEFPVTTKLAKVFGIRSIQIHSRAHVDSSLTTGKPVWTILGIGGIARFVIERAPFHGTRHAKDVPPEGAVAYGPDQPKIGIDLRLVIGIVGSESEAVNLINDKLQSLRSKNSLLHVFNLRPIGFGSPSSRRMSLSDVRHAMESLDCLWIVGNHRLRQSGNYQNTMSVVNTASRVVRIAVASLVTCLSHKSGRDFLQSIEEQRDYGLVGVAKYSPEVAVREMVFRVLYSMLYDGALLHTADRIVILWPHTVDEDFREMQIRLGRNTCRVTLIEGQYSKRSPVAVGFAMGVKVGSGSDSEFRNFCVSVMAGYRWRERHDDGRSILLENEGEAIRIWPVTSVVAIDQLLARESESVSRHDLIITNCTISKARREMAPGMGWGLVHYSELERWMKATFSGRVFEDW